MIDHSSNEDHAPDTGEIERIWDVVERLAERVDAQASQHPRDEPDHPAA